MTGAGLQHAASRGTSGIRIRLARPEDQTAVTRLFRATALASESAQRDDPGDDMLDVRTHYYVGAMEEGLGGVPNESQRAALWVAEDEQDGVVGMVGLRHISNDVVEMRRLRVEEAHRGRGIGSALVQHAVRVCAERSYLKVILDTFIERTSAVRLFERAGFILARTRPSENGTHARLDFYLDLYREQPGSR